MSKVAFLIIALFLTAAVRADDRAAQVEAARVAAVARIAEMISDEPIGRGYTAGQFIDRMDARAKLWEVLSSAQQVGGVRWIDSETCQVRVDVPAIKVGQLLLDLSLANPHKALVPYDLLDPVVHRWLRRSFSATASSLTWERAEQLAPPESAGAWRKVDPKQRRTALEAARADAGRQFVRTILAAHRVDNPDAEPDSSPEELGRENELAEWVAAQPVTSVQFRDDQSVQISLAIEPAELKKRFGDRFGDFSSPIVTGLGRFDTAAGDGGVVIPAEPPLWTAELLAAVGEAQFAGSPLKTARLAERAAAGQLRDRVRDLPWAIGQNLGEAAMLDPQLESAVDQALGQSRIAKVDYRADGSVQVRLTLDGQMIWRELSAGPRRPRGKLSDQAK